VSGAVELESAAPEYIAHGVSQLREMAMKKVSDSGHYNQMRRGRETPHPFEYPPRLDDVVGIALHHEPRSPRGHELGKIESIDRRSHRDQELNGIDLRQFERHERAE
jgi:hypothetical protein